MGVLKCHRCLRTWDHAADCPLNEDRPLATPIVERARDDAADALVEKMWQNELDDWVPRADQDDVTEWQGVVSRELYVRALDVVLRNRRLLLAAMGAEEWDDAEPRLTAAAITEGTPGIASGWNPE